MGPRYQTALSRRERIWPAAVVSGALHAALIAFAMLRSHGPEIDLEQKPIVAKLVKLGEKRPKDYLPVRDEPPAPAPAAPEPTPVPVATATAPVAPAPAVTSKVTAPKPPAATRPAPTPTHGTGKSLSSVLDRVRKETDQERWGSPDGDAMGDASEGEGDRYAALVTAAVHSNYRVPETISEKERMHLEAIVILTIQPDGRVESVSFERRSGNAAFDAALERAVRQARLPPPPSERRAELRTTGLGLRFRI